MGARFSTGLAATLLIATSGSIALVAAAFAFYGELEALAGSPVVASALTALLFAILALSAAVLAPRLIRARAAAAEAKAVARAREAPDQRSLRFGVEILLALLAGFAQARRYRRDQRSA